MARHAETLVLYKINFARPFTVKQIQELLNGLANDAGLGAMWLEARVSDEKMTYTITIGESQSENLKRHFEAHLPETELLEIKRPSKVRLVSDTAYELKWTQATFSLATERIEQIALSILTSMREAKKIGESVVIQIAVGSRYFPSVLPDRIPDLNQNWFERLLSPATMSPNLTISLKTRFASAGFCCAVRIGIAANQDKRRNDAIYYSILGGLNSAKIVGSRVELKAISPSTIHYATLPKGRCLTLCPNELAGLLAYPYNEITSPILPSLHPKVLTPPHDFGEYTTPRYEENPYGFSGNRRYFARSNADNYDKKLIGVDIDEAMKHTYVLGPTGSGKTTLLEHLILSDIYAGHGVVMIEPKGDSGREVLGRIPKERIKDVVYIDPTADNIVGINPFSAIKFGADPNVVAEGIYTIFNNLSDGSWGKRMGYVLMSGLITLTRIPNANLLMLLPLLTDKKFRADIVAKVSKDDRIGLGAFWHWYDEELKDAERQKVIAPVLSRLSEFTLKPALSAMLGQSQPKVDLNEVFTKNKIFIVSLNKSKIGSETAKLLGSLIVSQLWSLTLARANVEENKRLPVNIYIDEVQDYLNLPLDLAEALSQARSYQVGFTLAHQYRRQLPPSLMSAIDGNVQNVITFGLFDARDCIEMSKLFNDKLTPEDIRYQQQHNVYLRTLHNGQPIVVSGQTLAPSPRLQNPNEIKAFSAKTYGMARQDIYQQNLHEFYDDDELDKILESDTSATINKESEV